MSTSTTAQAQPLNLFNYSLRLTNKVGEDNAQTDTLYNRAVPDSPGTDTIAAATPAAGEPRLYFTGNGSSANLTALQRYLDHEEADKTSPLLRVLQLAPQSPTLNTQPLVYVEQNSLKPVPLPEDATMRRDAVLTTCTNVCTEGATPPRGRHAPVEAALCVFQDFMSAPATPMASEAPFWEFLCSTLRHYASDFYCSAAKVQLQGIIVPTFETRKRTVYNRDIFAHYVEEEEKTEKQQECNNATNKRTTGRKVCVKSKDALLGVMEYLRSHWPLFESELGPSHLVMNAKWTSNSTDMCASDHSERPAAKPAGALRQSACFVWLQNDTVKDERDGVYADAALEALLDELSLAAASISTPSEAAAVLQEEAISAFFEQCRLTHILKRVICSRFESVVLRRKALFHWVLSLPPHARLSTSAAGTAVTAVRFNDHPAVSQAVWSAIEMLVHWQQLADFVYMLARDALKRRFIKEDGRARRFVSAPPRFPRHRRIIQQSGLYFNSPRGGCVLDHHRGKVNVSQLYGTGEQRSVTSSPSATPGESLAVSSGLFQSTRSTTVTPFSNLSILDGEETFGSSPRLARNVITRIPQKQTRVHSVQ
ncbi:hypothetical protein JKF63_07191 [Porcisia hertigi]|uniref:Uncharacterized protein n=1 Tax=Porcisia hertigi TaxID=2761500 RepID=A0A836LKR1_9TRYP|nr:hypothetical protein JKF63_07191 [Porcisia hertigi]